MIVMNNLLEKNHSIKDLITCTVCHHTKICVINSDGL